MTSLRERLLAAFELEHKEHLTVVREALRAATEPGGPPLDLPEIHRRAHSLKGAARAVDLADVEAVAHRLESVFIGVQRGAVVLDDGAVSQIGRALDAIEDIVAHASRGGPPVEIGALLAGLDRLAGPGDGQPLPPPPPLAELPPPPPLPPADPRQRETPRLVRISSAGLERLLDTASALLPEVEGQAALAQDLRQLSREFATLEQSWRRLRRGLSRHGAGGSDRRMTDAMAAFERRLLQLGGGLVVSQRRHDRGLWSLRRWGNGLADDVRRLRMVPTETQFGMLGRMVRDLARSQGKEVEVDLRGLDVEADRVVLQRLKDPVIHLVRNAVNHGIERPEERIAAGRRAAGRIVFETTTVGNRLCLTIEDDGRGVDTQAVARQGLSRGRLTAEEADALSPARALDLLFEPGFSTADALTEIAGRGMGLPIAQQEVMRLQGTIGLSPRTGGGTVVRIEVPVTLSAQRLVFVQVSGHVLGLPGTDVARLLRVGAETVFTLAGKPSLRLEDDGSGEAADVPLVPLAGLLGLPLPEPGERLAVVVLRAGSRRLAVLVDGLLATRDTVVTTIDEVGLDPERFVGTVVMEDGSPALVLNPTGLLNAAAEIAAAVVAAPRRAAPRRRAHILVVDDSITTRTLEKSILEAHGYRVTQCVDGREALERLHEGGVDLVVSDVEMPRMDGFALLQAVKEDPGLGELPVVLVTSRGSDEDRARGLRLKADAYIVKTRFDQDELLDAIRRLL